MPPKPSLQSLGRQFQSCAPHKRAGFSSSTAKYGTLKFINPDATRSLIDLDDDKGSSEASRYAFNSTSPDQPYGNSAHETLKNLINSSGMRDRLNLKREDRTKLAKETLNRESLGRQATRKWKPGEIYAPHDLSPQEMLKWKQPKQPAKDIIDVLGLNPLDHYRNFSIMSEFMTQMGRIKHSKETGLRPVNQRKMAKAIRRSIGMGLHPSTHFHPMILFQSMDNPPRYQNPKIPEPDRQRIKPK